MERARPFLVAVLDDERRPARDRREAAAALAAFGDDASMAALMARASTSAVAPDLAVRVMLRASDQAAAFDKLAPRFRDDALVRAAVADELGRVGWGVVALGVPVALVVATRRRRRSAALAPAAA